MMTNWRFVKSGISFFGLVLLLASCFQSDYTRLVKAELAKGIRQDSIFLGISLGDSRQDFFGRCFDLNKQRLVTQGPRGLTVQFDFKDSLVHSQPTDMRILFSPIFDSKTTMAGMEWEVTYLGWSPWVRNYQSDSLKVKTLKLLKLWYKGNDFVQAKVGEEMIPVKVDGNRRILVRVKDTQFVRVTIQDILHPMFRHANTEDMVGEQPSK